MTEKIIVAHNADEPQDELDTLRCSYQEISECPMCHFAMSPKVLSAFYVKQPGICGDSYDLNILGLCPNCHRAFLTLFRSPKSYCPDPCIQFGTARLSVPQSWKSKISSKEISELSPDFVEIYAQADAAEMQGLGRICGSGYRKALEYLVKDYLCNASPDDTESIRRESLGASIQRINDVRIKTLAERSAWIGNDETHCIRKHDQLNINDMKCFIKAVLSYIESELAFNAAEAILRK